MILDDIKAVFRTHLLPPESEAWTEGLDMEAAALAVLHLFSPTMLEMERRIAELEAMARGLAVEYRVWDLRVARGERGSDPRDCFETHIDAAAEDLGIEDEVDDLAKARLGDTRPSGDDAEAGTQGREDPA